MPQSATSVHRESELARFVGTFQIVMLSVFNDQRIHPYIAYDFGPLSHALGEDRVKKLFIAGNGRVDSFLRTRGDKILAIDESTLLAMLEDMKATFLKAIG